MIKTTSAPPPDAVRRRAGANHARRLLFAAALCALAWPAAPAAAGAADPRDEEIRLLREQIRQLDARLRHLEARESASIGAAPAAASATVDNDAAADKNRPKLTVNDHGITLASADDSTALRLRAYLQADSRWYLDEPGTSNADGFVLRRARIIFEGRFGKLFQYQIAPEYGGGGVSLVDGNINLAFSPAFQMKMGKFKTPVGLEVLQPGTRTLFIEYSLATNLAPNRDVGIQAGGAWLGRTVEYQAGVFNGVGEGRSSQGNADFDGGKDFVARVFSHPFRNRPGSFFSGLGIGIAGGMGRQKGAQARTAGYRTDGMQAFFAYHDSVVQDGPTWRCSPQAFFYKGPFGVFGEYVKSAVRLRAGEGGSAHKIKNTAWQLAASYVLTGENASYESVDPKHPFNLEKDAWGAFEIAARYDSLDIDGTAFAQGLADPGSSATAASSWTLGLNWHLNRALRLMINYVQTDLDRAQPEPTGALLREGGERAVLTRAQIAF